MSLTTKQEIFVQRLFEGDSQREAYKFAFNCDKMKDTTIDVRACELFKNGKIQVRYQELLDEHKNKALYSREEAVNDLIWLKEQARESIIDQGLRQANGGHFLNATKELCLLEDLYPAKDKKDDKKQEEQIAKVLKEALEEI